MVLGNFVCCSEVHDLCLSLHIYDFLNKKTFLFFTEDENAQRLHIKKKKVAAAADKGFSFNTKLSSFGWEGG